MLQSIPVGENCDECDVDSSRYSVGQFDVEADLRATHRLPANLSVNDDLRFGE
jgi:hypothetical protein